MEVSKRRLSEFLSFIECMFFYWMQRWHLLAATYLFWCLLIKDSERLGQVKKWAHLMALMNVYFMGLKNVPCRKFASSDLVCTGYMEI